MKDTQESKPKKKSAVWEHIYSLEERLDNANDTMKVLVSTISSTHERLDEDTKALNAMSHIDEAVQVALKGVDQTFAEFSKAIGEIWDEFNKPWWKRIF